ncbi:MAG: hypothetical protein M1314_02730 [Firmicutes bacterium]|nr:hypothetical protein [Bacillota bacterium]
MYAIGEYREHISAGLQQCIQLRARRARIGKAYHAHVKAGARISLARENAHSFEFLEGFLYDNSVVADARGYT